MLGNRLLSSKAYGVCSKNDTELKGLFEHLSFWNTTPVKDIDGAPGLPSGVFDGKIWNVHLPVSIKATNSFINTIFLIIYKVERCKELLCLHINFGIFDKCLLFLTYDKRNVVIYGSI